jgi:AcrR family transcriptional regulator
VQRARSQANRAQRLADILQAAALLFDQVGPELTLDQVAAAVGLTRSTLYGYASTREELLLLLVDAELTDWFEGITPAVRRCRSAAGVARVIVEQVVARPRLAPLLAQCSIVFERNVSLDAAKQWKVRVHDQLLEAGRVIDTTLQTKPGCGARFLLHVHASVVGLHSLSSPPPIAAKAIAETGSTTLLVDFERELQVAIRSLAETLLLPTKEYS